MTKKKPISKEKVYETKKHIGKIIRKLRTAQKMTKYEFGRLSGLNSTQIDAIERGDYAYTVDTLIKISEIFQFDIVGLLLNHSENIESD